MNHKMIKKISYGAYLFFITAIGLEILLRIYNPFDFRLKGDKILLPVNQRLLIRNAINPRLDSEIINTRNGIGFRGPEMPEGVKDSLSIIAIGGSATECHFLNDDKTWPYQAGLLLTQRYRSVWMNNAGLDGHSSFGHQVLLNDHVIKLKPRLILFLTGINDVENEAPTFHDKLNTRGAYPDLKHFLYNNSEILQLIVNISRGWRAQRLNNTTQRLRTPEKNDTLTVSAETMNARLSNQKMFLERYAARINQLIDTCLAHDIQPVWITQSCLPGPVTDSITQTDLSLMKIEDHMNGLLYWKILELYNDQVRQICAGKHIPLIDLARLMPKNSRYYYDVTHFTNEGAQRVGAIVAENLEPLLDEKFPDYRRAR